MGAINTGAAAQFAPGQEIPMSNFLLNLWRSINGSSDIYVNWPGGELEGLLFHSGIYNTAPLVNLLRNNFLYGINRNFSVGSTNMDTGLFGTFNESVGGAGVDAVLCSCSPPPIFPTHQFEGYTWSDGGCVENLDVASAITRCLEITTEENTIVDMIFDNYYEGLGNETKFKSLEVFERAYGIRSYDSSVWYLYQAQIAYPLATFRYIIVPSEPLPTSKGRVPLNFTPAAIEYEIQLGINDTKAMLKNPRPTSDIIEELRKAKSQTIFP